MSRVHRSTSGIFGWAGLLGATLVVLGTGACGEPPTEAPVTIDRSAFIDVYVDLRDVALRKTSRVINAAERDSVLAQHQVSEDDLRFFLEVHHTRAEFMKDLWNEVEARVSLLLDMGSRPEGA